MGEQNLYVCNFNCKYVNFESVILNNNNNNNISKKGFELKTYTLNLMNQTHRQLLQFRSIQNDPNSIIVLILFLGFDRLNHLSYLNLI